MILFSDFDDTLYFKHEPEKNGANLAALRTWRAEGNLFCITTGRSLKSVTNELPQIQDLCDYSIVDSGSIILDSAGEILMTFTLAPEIVLEMLRISKSFSEIPVPFFYTQDSEGVARKTEHITKLRFWFKDTGLLQGTADVLRNRFPVLVYSQDLPASRYPELDGCQGFVEILPDFSGKSNAIQFLERTLGFTGDAIVTVGDGPNDYDMIRDFDGYMISGSILDRSGEKFRRTDSIASLVTELLTKGH